MAIFDLQSRAGTAISHARGMWNKHWYLPLLPALYCLILAGAGALRPEHVIVAVVVAALGFAAPLTKRSVSIAYPLLLIALAYDVFHFLQPKLVTPATVWSCRMRALELSVFAKAPNLTWQDYFAVHHSAAFDVFFAIPYGVFLFAVAAYGVYLSFVDELRSRRFVWAVAVAYLLSIALWMTVPAAPPWYVRTHGCSIDTSVLGSAAGLLRVDQLLGIHYFADFYAHSPAVFAAFPSMHCAFPVIGMLVGWSGASWVSRPVHVLYSAAMFCASIYLDHHWIVDGVVAWMVAAIGAYSAPVIMRALGQLPPMRKGLDRDPVIAA